MTNLNYIATNAEKVADELKVEGLIRNIMQDGPGEIDNYVDLNVTSTADLISQLKRVYKALNYILNRINTENI